MHDAQNLINLVWHMYTVGLLRRNKLHASHAISYMDTL